MTFSPSSAFNKIPYTFLLQDIPANTSTILMAAGNYDAYHFTLWPIKIHPLIFYGKGWSFDRIVKTPEYQQNSYLIIADSFELRDQFLQEIKLRGWIQVPMKQDPRIYSLWMKPEKKPIAGEGS
jgi:hypothetical protein